MVTLQCDSEVRCLLNRFIQESNQPISIMNLFNIAASLPRWSSQRTYNLLRSARYITPIYKHSFASPAFKLQVTTILLNMNSSIMGLLGTYPYHTLALLFLSYVLFRRWEEKDRNVNPKGLPLPPGPKGYPLIGNLFDMPASKPWILYDQWFKVYGEPPSLIFNGLSVQTLFNGCWS